MIFICYSWADAETVHYLKRQLAAVGCAVWIDSEHLDLDAPLEEQIWKSKFAKPFANPRAYCFLIRQIREIQSGSDVN